jgi:peptidoglycan/LPS O-acetylase OafA/YrhL
MSRLFPLQAVIRREMSWSNALRRFAKRLVYPRRPAAPTPAAGTTAHSFRPDIEGLRAVAVVMVMLDHAGLSALSGGFIGVDVFFVLSGFLITGLLLKEMETRGCISLTRFYARRFRRLLPAGSLVLIATLISSYALLDTDRANRIATDARWSTLFAANFRFIQQGTDYFAAQLPPSPLQHFWSLAVEEQFYAVWPAVMIVSATMLKRIPLRLKLSVILAGIIAASLFWSIHQTRIDATAAYFSPFPRAGELGVGTLLAVMAERVRRINSRWLGEALSGAGLALIVLTGVAFDEATKFPGVAVMAPVAGAAMVVAGGTIAPAGGGERLLRLPPFQWVGKLSYSLYLWHWPILVIAAGAADHDLTLMDNLLLCAVAIAFSAATYILVEHPVRDSVMLRARRPVLSLGLGVCLVVAAFGASTWFRELHPVHAQQPAALTFPSTSSVLNAVAAGVSAGPLPAQPAAIANLAYVGDCNVDRTDTDSTPCTGGDVNGARTLVLYGDSHAAQWFPAFDVIGKQTGWKVLLFWKPSCPVPEFDVYSDRQKRAYHECDAFRGFVLAQLQALHPDMVLISSEYRYVRYVAKGEPTRTGLEPVWDHGLDAMLTKIKPLTNDLKVIGDIAYTIQEPSHCTAQHASNISKCNAKLSDVVWSEHNEAEQRIAAAHGVAYINVVPWLCAGDVCPSVIDGLVTHGDTNHISSNYAVHLAGVMAGAAGLIPNGQMLHPVSTKQ